MSEYRYGRAVSFREDAYAALADALDVAERVGPQLDATEAHLHGQIIIEHGDQSLRLPFFAQTFLHDLEEPVDGEDSGDGHDDGSAESVTTEHVTEWSVDLDDSTSPRLRALEEAVRARIEGELLETTIARAEAFHQFLTGGGDA